MIRIGDQAGDDQANRQIGTTTRRINKTNKNIANNPTNYQITRSMVGQGRPSCDHLENHCLQALTTAEVYCKASVFK